MDYKYIIHPNTNKKIRINSKIGKRIIYNYVKTYLSQIGSGAADKWIIKNNPEAIQNFKTNIYNNRPEIEDEENFMNYIETESASQSNNYYWLMRIVDDEWFIGGSESINDLLDESETLDNYVIIDNASQD